MNPPGRIVYHHGTVTHYITTVAVRLAHKLRHENIMVVPILKGGMYYACRLTSHWNFAFDWDYIWAQRYDLEDVRLAKSPVIHRRPPAKVLANRTILLVDDIADEGVTLQRVYDLCAPICREVYMTVLIDRACVKCAIKEHPNYYPALVDYSSDFFFGCGMDVNGFWRQLPEIRTDLLE